MYLFRNFPVLNNFFVGSPHERIIMILLYIIQVIIFINKEEKDGCCTDNKR